jgi:hypothetical protein
MIALRAGGGAISSLNKQTQERANQNQIYSHNEMKTMSCEAALQEYFAAFNGTKKDFSELGHLFDAVSHEKFTLVIEGETLDRDTAKAIDAGYLAEDLKIKIVVFRRIDTNHIDVQARAQNKEEHEDIHVVFTVEDNKIAKAHVIDDCKLISEETSTAEDMRKQHFTIAHHTTTNRATQLFNNLLQFNSAS